VIDHTTISKFLSRHWAKIIELFAQVVEICAGQNLIEFEGLAIDTVKIKANASYKQWKNRKGLEGERKRLRQRIEEIVDSAGSDKEQMREREVLEGRLRKVEVASYVLEERLKEKCRGKSEREKEEVVERERVNTTDPSATIMSQANGEHNPMYAITTATDTKADVITYFEVRRRWKVKMGGGRV